MSLTDNHDPRVGAELSVDKTPGIMRAAAQYGISQNIMDLCTFDVTKNPWRCGELFDAIITDPPCKLNLVSPRKFNLTSRLQMEYELAQNG